MQAWTLPLASALIALAACDRASGPSVSDAALPAPVSEPIAVTCAGRVSGWREADVTAKLAGPIVAFEADEGQQVAEDAVVARLDDRDLRARVRAAEAQARQSALTLARLRELRREGMVAPSEVDHAEAESRTDAAMLEEARVSLEYAKLRAPFAGTIVRRYKEVGESIAVNMAPDPVFRLADESRLKVTAEVPERDIGQVAHGQGATITSEAHPAEVFPAEVVRVGAAVGRKALRTEDPRERLDQKVVEVELALAADPRLKSGMTVDVVFATAAASTASRSP